MRRPVGSAASGDARGSAYIGDGCFVGTRVVKHMDPVIFTNMFVVRVSVVS